jgi:selenocysteine-specific elongation factor
MRVTNRMTNIIVGTAGHIDHGKSALVRALTGIEPDRLAEERQRGISIDLGFAHLDLGGGILAGFVDVPGHERFVRNMLAGAGGIDVVLLVVAADEGVKPQTREHFEICRLLGIGQGVVALTKSDLSDEAMLEVAQLEAAELLEGSALAGAPVVAVSSVTGAGLDELKARLREAAARARPRDAEGVFRLPVDRSFSIRGFGTVVTGTLWSGRLCVGGDAALYPGNRMVRVRGLQVHGSAVEEARAGQRTAVNLAGIEAREIARGMTLAPAGLLEATAVIDAQFELLKTAKPLKHRAPAHFHSGTAAVEAEVRLLGEVSKPVAPGETAWIRLVLKEPVLLLPGDRFIVRSFSPVVTIGGGVVADIAPPAKWKRAAIAERLPKLVNASLAERIRLHAMETGDGARAAALAARCGATVERVMALAEEAGCRLLRDPEPRLVPEDSFKALVSKLEETLRAWHKEKPLEAGMPRRAIAMEAWLLEALLAARADLFAAESDLVRLKTHAVALSGEVEEAASRMEMVFKNAGLAVPAVPEALAGAGIDVGRARTLLELLLRQGLLVRISPDLIYHREALDKLRQMLASRRGQPFTVPEFKEWTGISRKFAIPLLEYFDKERVTRRLADKRVVV